MKLSAGQPSYIGKLLLIGGVLCGVLLPVAWAVMSRLPVANNVNVAITNITAQEESFPDVDTTQLPPVRRDILSLAKQEYHAQPEANKYSEGVEEPWCADFVSWIMKEAGAPLENPYSGGWRIPGTFTLKDYYESVGKFRLVDSGYTPQPGDIAIYRGSPKFGDHTNIVLRVEDGVMTTVGGNENGKIRVYKNTDRDYTGLLGYGVV